MAWITPPVFVALQTLTDSVMNQLSSRLSDLFPYTTIGDMPYASATDTLSRLGIGTAGQVLKTNSGATAPEWAGVSLAKVTRATAQSINNSSYTAISFSSAEIDTNSYWAGGAPTRLTVPSTGYYLVEGHVDWDTNATNVRESKLYVNGVEDKSATDGRAALSGVATRCSSLLSLVYLTASQYVELYAWQNSGSALNANAGTCFLSIVKIGVA